MFDELVAIIAKMQLPTLSENSHKEFLSRTRHLAPNLTLAKFNDLLKEKPSNNFTNSELKQIRKYLKYWPALIKQLNIAIEIIHIVWFDTQKKMLGGDDVLPVFCDLLPRNELVLAGLEEKFLFASDVDPTDKSTYFFTVLSSAVAQIQTDINRCEHNVALIPQLYSHASFIDKIKNPLYFNLVRVLVDLSESFLQLMRTYEDRIFASLAAHGNKAYPDNDFVSDEEKHLRRSDDIMKMMSQLKLEPFASDAKLRQLVQQHSSFQDFEATLSRSHILSILALPELALKFNLHQQYSTVDLNSVEIEINEKVRLFLGIPAISKNAVINLFTFFLPARTKISLATYIEHLTSKIRELDMVDEKKPDLFVIPVPEQLADLLRQSF